MMRIEVFKLSAFTNDINGGNPAGVVLHADGLSQNQMQQLAREIGFSETAFVSRSDSADFRVRFFTPCAEIELCGHATIAAFCLMKQKGLLPGSELCQETGAGILRIRSREASIYMEQELPRFYDIIEKKELLSCLGIGESDFVEELPVQVVSTGLRDILVPLKDQTVLKGLKPDMKGIEAISRKYNAVGIHAFCTAGKDIAASCRNFAPLYGIPEESATGTSNGALVCYLHQYGVIKEELLEAVIEQGMYMGRPSLVRVQLSVHNHTPVEVWVGGEAVILGRDSYQV